MDVSVTSATSPPPQSKPKDITLPAKIGISVGVVLVVGIIIGVLVYVFVFKNKSGGSGVPASLGTISVKDTTSNVQTNQFAPGDTLQLQYTPTATGFSGKSVWSMSTDGGKTYSVQIADPSFSNVAVWTIPANIFTKQAVFKVQSVVDADEFVDTSGTAMTITPPFKLLSGPGVSSAGDTVFQNSNFTCVIGTDTGLPGLNATNWSIQMSQDPQFKNGVTNATLVSSTIDTSKGQVTMVMYQSAAISNVFYRISTTGLVAQGYPFELVAVSPFAISVTSSASCSGVKPPSPTDFFMCQLVMAETGSGRSTNFTPGSSVTMVLAYVNTYPSSPVSFAYSVDGGTAQPWTPVTTVSAANGTATYTATLPSLVTSSFVVTITSGTQHVSSAAYNLVATLTILNVPKDSVITINPLCNSVNYVVTTVGRQPLTYKPTAWRVGYSNLDGSGLNMFNNVSNATYNDTNGQAQLTWCMNWGNFFATSPLGNITRLLVISNETGSVSQSVEVIFNVVAYFPNFTTLSGYQVQTNAYEEFALLNETFVFQPGGGLPIGMWPDPAGSSNVYISTQLINGDNRCWWFGAVLDNQNITDAFPDAPNPVNLVLIETMRNNTYDRPPNAKLYKITASSKAGNINISSADTGQVLWLGPMDMSQPWWGTFANASVNANGTSNFIWVNQVIPH